MFWLGLENGLEFRLTLDIYSQEASESKLDRKWGLRDVPLNRISFLCTDNGHIIADVSLVSTELD